MGKLRAAPPVLPEYALTDDALAELMVELLDPYYSGMRKNYRCLGCGTNGVHRAKCVIPRAEQVLQALRARSDKALRLEQTRDRTNRRSANGR